MYSKEGYKRNSPDKNNPYNIINSKFITMKDVEFPVMGISNTGHKILMQPGQDYVFDGDYVIEYPYMQQGGVAGMDGMIKARLAIDSHFGNPTAKRITNYDTRSYEFPNGDKGNVYVSSYDNLVTPQIQDVNGQLMFIDNPWSEENANRSYNQSMKFERPEDAEYFGENYKKYAPMMKLYQKGGIHINPANKGKFTAQANRANMGVQEYANYVLRNKEDFSSTTIKRANFARNANKWKKQEGGEMNEEIIMKIQEALQQGITPEQLVKELQKQGITEQEAIQLVSAAIPQQEEMQQYQYGTTVRHNYADNINFDNKFNTTALGLNAVSDPRNMTWALPDTGFGSGFKAISGLASGLAGSYLGYAKLFSNDKITNNTPTATIGKNPNIQIQAPYRGTDSEKALPTPWGKEYDLPKELNPYNGDANIQGTNQYSTFQKGGMKKYQWAGMYYDNPVNRKTTIGLPIINNVLPSDNIDFNIEALVPKTDPNPIIKSESWSNVQNPWLSQYGDNTNPNPPRIYTKDAVPNKMDRLTYQHYFPDAIVDEVSIAMDNYQNKDINVNNNQNNDLAITNNKPKNNSTITSMNDDALGFMIANNALIGFQNFNDVLSARDYEKEYNQMLMRTGNSDQKYNPINPTNPYGMYTPNVGIGSNYGLVANSHIQDFGTSMASAKCGGMKKKYKEGGEYNLTQEEIDYILKNGGEIEILD